MAECEADQLPMPDYYSPFKPDRSVIYTQLQEVPRAAYLSKRVARKKERTQELEKKRKEEVGRLLDFGPKIEIPLKESIASVKQIVQSLHKELFECEETIKYTERVIRGLKEDTQVNDDKINELAEILDALDQELERLQSSDGQEFSAGSCIDNKLKIKENMIQRIMEAHKRLVDDYQRKKQLYSQTDDKVRRSIPENRILLTDAHDSLRKAKWSLRDMNTAIQTAEEPTIPQAELENSLMIAKTSVALNENIVSTATQKREAKEKEIDRLKEQLQTYIINREVYAEHSKCLPFIVKAENTGRLLFDFILKAKIQLKECYDAIHEREDYLKDLRVKHNLQLKHEHVHATQRLGRTRSAGGYSMMTRHSPAVREGRLSVSDNYLQGNVMLNMLDEPTDSDQQDATEDLARFHGESMIEELALTEDFVDDTTINLPVEEIETVFAAPSSPIRQIIADTTVNMPLEEIGAVCAVPSTPTMIGNAKYGGIVRRQPKGGRKRTEFPTGEYFIDLPSSESNISVPAEETRTVRAKLSAPITPAIVGNAKYGGIVRREPKGGRKRTEFPTGEYIIDLPSSDTSINLPVAEVIATVCAAPSTPIQPTIVGNAKYGGIVRREPKGGRKRTEFPTGEYTINLPSSAIATRSQPVVEEIAPVCAAPSTPIQPSIVGNAKYGGIVRREPKGGRKRTEFPTGEYSINLPSSDTPTRYLPAVEEKAPVCAAPSTPIQPTIVGNPKYGGIVRRQPKGGRKRTEFPTGVYELPSPETLKKFERQVMGL